MTESKVFEIPSKCILHISTGKNWEEALKTGKYVGDTLSTQGFIHFSLPSQLIEVANYLYEGRRDLVLLYVNESQVMNEVRYERPEGEEEASPHLYGSLPVSAVVGVTDFTPREDGQFTLPENLRGLCK